MKQYFFAGNASKLFYTKWMYKLIQSVFIEFIYL